MTTNFKTAITKDKIAIWTLDLPSASVNILSEVVLRELNDLIDNITTDTNIKGLVIKSAKKDFIVGADISDITKLKTAEDAAKGAGEMQGILNRLAGLRIPTVAAIHGQCLGGGLELALACKWRVASDDSTTKLGFPEIQLGLIPGAGGTQRTTRLIGIIPAVDILLTAKKLPSKKALKLGLLDAAVDRHILEEIALSYAKRARGAPGPLFIKKPLVHYILEETVFGRNFLKGKARKTVTGKTKGFYPASYKMLDAVFDGYPLKLERALALEAKIFGELAITSESQSLIHLYNATTFIKKHPYVNADKERFGNDKIRSIGIYGAGLMGGGIANVCADKGIRVLLSDPNRDSIGLALNQTKKFFFGKVKRKHLKPFQAVSKISHVSPGLSPTGFGKTDLIIEAVFENIELKRKLVKEFEGYANDNAIFASNTSALPIADIAANTPYRDRIIGMHFFSPVEKMPLLEIVRTPKTADWVLARAIQLGQTAGKQVIVVQDSPGFFTTRVLAFYLMEAALMLAEGTRIEVIDQALQNFGFPVGPITLMDEVGIDVAYHVAETMERHFGDRISLPPSFKIIIEKGRLGRKTNKGFFEYKNGVKGKPDEGIYNLIQNVNADKTSLSHEEIVDRCLLLFINESARCLEEKILHHPHDGDIGAVFGLGFPPFWGGPFKYLDHKGALAIVEKMRHYALKYGPRFTPAAILVDMATSAQRFFPDENCG